MCEDQVEVRAADLDRREFGRVFFHYYFDVLDVEGEFVGSEGKSLLCVVWLLSVVWLCVLRFQTAVDETC